MIAIRREAGRGFYRGKVHQQKIKKAKRKKAKLPTKIKNFTVPIFLLGVMLLSEQNMQGMLIGRERFGVFQGDLLFLHQLG